MHFLAFTSNICIINNDTNPMCYDFVLTMSIIHYTELTVIFGSLLLLITKRVNWKHSLRTRKLILHYISDNQCNFISLYVKSACAADILNFCVSRANRNVIHCWWSFAGRPQRKLLLPFHAYSYLVFCMYQRNTATRK